MCCSQMLHTSYIDTLLSLTGREINSEVHWNERTAIQRGRWITRSYMPLLSSSFSVIKKRDKRRFNSIFNWTLVAKILFNLNIFNRCIDSKLMQWFICIIILVVNMIFGVHITRKYQFCLFMSKDWTQCMYYLQILCNYLWKSFNHVEKHMFSG